MTNHRAPPRFEELVELSPREALDGLAGKYQRLLLLALEEPATHAGGYATRRRGEKRAVARAFPGALRELDLLGVEGLRARSLDVARCRAELGDARDWGALPADLRWVRWMADLHALLRDALSSRVGADARGTPAVTRELRPRLLDSAFAGLSLRHGVPADQIREALFPGPTGRGDPR